jgi:esterase/lipase superfamily enzyme
VEEFGPLARTIRPFDEDIEPSEEPGHRFIAEIKRRLARSTSKDVYIYVHGYKVDFENPVLVASELWHFLGYQGAFIAFSWPTTARKLAYFSDIENAQASARALRQLVVYISEESQAERIHIIGYSAGTRLVGRVLADIGMLGYGLDDDEVHRRARLGHVILTGSDVDRAIIGGYILDGALKVPASVTIYVSDADSALGVSKFVFTRQRSGQMADPDEVGPRTRKFFEDTDKLRIIDVSDAEGSKTGNGHAYFRSSPWVSSDILMTLLYDLPPAKRGLAQSESVPVWTFPDDYTKRMRVALASSNPALFTGAQ